ncbi:Tyrosine recombinase XerC [Burkholderia multivorans]
MKVSITSKTGRERLQPRREPYWGPRIASGLYIGFRRLASGSGTWVARRRGEDGRQAYRALGSVSEYDEAVKAATAWAGELDAGVVNERVSVSGACERYVAWLRLHRSAASAHDTEIRFKRLVYGKSIGQRDLAKLRPAYFNDWLAAHVPEADDPEIVRKSKDSANRNWNSLRAALNLAMRDRLVATDNGWRTVVPFGNVRRRRDGFISIEGRRSLLAACEDDFATFVRGLLLTAARPGELAKVRAKDFDRKAGTLALSGKTGHRVVPVSHTAARLLSELAAGKIGDALLFCRADGAMWLKDCWKKVFRAARDAAGLPGHFVVYSLRHTAISELIMGGMDAFSVAKVAGTSMQMIDKHYGHLRRDFVRAALDAVTIL